MKFKIVSFISLLVIICAVLPYEVEAYVGTHHEKALTLGHYRVKRAPQNPVTTTTTSRPSSTTVTTSTESVTIEEESENGSEQVSDFPFLKN